MPLPPQNFKDTQSQSTGNVNRWNKVPAAYNAGGAQTDANWNDASIAVIREFGHNLSGAAGPHFGNFTGTQEPFPGPRTGYPIDSNDSVHTGGPVRDSVQPAERESLSTQDTKGTSATIEPAICPGPPPGPGTGAPAYGTGAGTRPAKIAGHDGGSTAAVSAYQEEHGTAPPPKPSFRERVKGSAEKTLGKLTHKPGMVERGTTKTSGGSRDPPT